MWIQINPPHQKAQMFELPIELRGVFTTNPFLLYVNLRLLRSALNFLMKNEQTVLPFANSNHPAHVSERPSLYKVPEVRTHLWRETP